MSVESPVAPPNRLVVIAGPTGTGKSSLALDLARRFGGEIVNCDSAQLYRGFDTGTAKTPLRERAPISHHLFDVLTPQESYSAGEYARRARAILEEISSRGGLPLVVGGTGFYLQALLEGLPPLPDREPSLRLRLEKRERKRPGSVHRILQRLDPEAAARIHPRDQQKTVRALEVRMLTGRPAPPPAASQALGGYRVLKLGLDPDRAEFERRLEARTRAIFASGLIQEVQDLLAGSCSGEEKPFEALGYRQALRVIRGSLSPEEAIASTLLETRQYAKRQRTWFRRDREIRWLRGFGDAPELREEAATLLNSL